MADFFTLLDWIAALLFGGALAMVALSEQEIKIARWIVWAAAALFMTRWIMWGFTTDQPLWIRLLIGAFVGAFVAGVLPPSLKWITQHEGKSSEEKLVSAKPNIAMRLIYPERPAIVLENNSDATAMYIKYTVALFNIGGPDAGKPLQIPIKVFDFIKEHEIGGPQVIFDPPQIDKTPPKGQKLFGWVQISCPECVKTRYYYTYIHFGLNRVVLRSAPRKAHEYS